MISIITDSTACLTRREAQDMGIRVLPVNYSAFGRMFNEVYADCNGDYMQLLKSGNVKTSQTNIATFLSAFEEEARRGNQVLCVTLSSRLSGTYSSASIAARALSGADIIVVDSLLTAGGMFFLLKLARKLIDEGKSLKEVVERLEQYRANVGTAFSVDDMGPLRRSGRLGLVKQSVGTMLNIKPLMMLLEGSVISEGIARGKREQIKRLAGLVSQGSSNVIVHYISDRDTAEKVAEEIKKSNPNASVSLRVLGPVLGANLGTGVIGVIWTD